MPLLGSLEKDVTAIYVGVFGRAPEGEGLNYWVHQAEENNWDLRTLAENMYLSAIEVLGYENLADPRELVKAVYLYVLGKTEEDDPKGINYWVNEIKDGKVTAGKVIADIVYSALTEYPNHPATKTLLNRVDAGIQIAKKIMEVDINFNGEIDEQDISVFREMIQKVTQDPESIKEVLKQATFYEVRDYVYDLPYVFYNIKALWFLMEQGVLLAKQNQGRFEDPNFLVEKIDEYYEGTVKVEVYREEIPGYGELLIFRNYDTPKYNKCR